jgi:outer membrane lipoprotein-sorting protein
MIGFRSLFVVAGTLAALTVPPFGAKAADSSLETAFARLDKAAATFKGMTADMKRTHHTELVNANEVDEGNIIVKKYKPGDVRMLINLTKPDPKIVSIGNGKAISYSPKTQEVDEFDIRKHKDLVNEVLLLGFGSSSRDLQSAYTITPGGPETVNGTSVIRIGLVPKNEELKHSIRQAELWIPENGVPVQQKFYETGGDYQIATYSNMVINPNIPDSALKVDVPKGVKAVTHR